MPDFEPTPRLDLVPSRLRPADIAAEIRNLPDPRARTMKTFFTHGEDIPMARVVKEYNQNPDKVVAVVSAGAEDQQEMCGQGVCEGQWPAGEERLLARNPNGVQLEVVPGQTTPVIAGDAKNQRETTVTARELHNLGEHPTLVTDERVAKIEEILDEVSTASVEVSRSPAENFIHIINGLFDEGDKRFIRPSEIEGAEAAFEQMRVETLAGEIILHRLAPGMIVPPEVRGLPPLAARFPDGTTYYVDAAGAVRSDILSGAIDALQDPEMLRLQILAKINSGSLTMNEIRAKMAQIEKFQQAATAERSGENRQIVSDGEIVRITDQLLDGNPVVYGSVAEKGPPAELTPAEILQRINGLPNIERMIEEAIAIRLNFAQKLPGLESDPNYAKWYADFINLVTRSPDLLRQYYSDYVREFNANPARPTEVITRAPDMVSERRRCAHPGCMGEYFDREASIIRDPYGIQLGFDTDGDLVVAGRRRDLPDERLLHDLAEHPDIIPPPVFADLRNFFSE